jgi:Spondin_N
MMSTRFQTTVLVASCAAATLLMAACTSGSPTAPGQSSGGGGPAPAGADAPATARYRVTFQSTWTGDTHPVDFPSDAHFSRLVGGTHNASVAFWTEGTRASAGIKDMAERGRTTPLDREVNAAIAAGTAQHVLVGGAIDDSLGSVSLEFEIGRAHPLVTLVSMVAPSPDWFVGVSSLPLFQDGRWVESRRVDLVPWDAGTDSGSTFTAPDLVTTPPQAVSRIVTAPLSPSGRVTPLGTFTFARLPG